MKAYASTLAVLGLQTQEKVSRYKVRRDAGSGPSGATALIEVRNGMVPFSSVATLASLLRINAADLLAVVGLSPRTATRRKSEGFLMADEADRLLRVARVFEEAIRVLGSQEKASAWLRADHPMLGNLAPYRLLDSDAGAKAVTDELIRIDFGDFA
jgi:putative toxin-antitoxin system antitoxin component (TIGR02293 family)